MIHMLPQTMALFDKVDQFFLPHSGSISSEKLDPVWDIVLVITTFFFILVVGMMFLFMFKYRRRQGVPPSHDAATHNTPLEVAWTAIPLIIVLALFFVGLKGYMWYDKPPSDSYTIVAKLSQWKFLFYYPNGGVSPYLYVPLNKDVRLQIEAEPDDVLHALYIPAYRIQRGAVPGRITELWFKAADVPPVHEGAADPGSDASHYYDIFCTQYCGDGHSQMRSRVYVIKDAKDFQKKLEDLANPFVDPTTHQPLALAKVGENLVNIYGCRSCHTIDGTANTGPTWHNLYKSDVKFSRTSEADYTLSASDSDEKWHAYFIKSIIHPSLDIVYGFQDVMTNFEPTLGGDPKDPANRDPTDPAYDKRRRLEAIIQYIMSQDQNDNGKPKYYKALPVPTSAPAPSPATQQ